MNVILASTSPRRKELLEKLNCSFKTINIDCDEKLSSQPKNPFDIPLLIAKRKLQAALNTNKNIKNTIIIAADTLVFLNNKPIGKPTSIAEAKKFLKALSNNIHYVVTGMAFAVIKNNTIKKLQTKSITKVWFRKISDKEIDGYIKKENVLDKAGAYGIQNYGMSFVKKIEGNYHNVMGLDVAVVQEILNKYN